MSDRIDRALKAIDPSSIVYVISPVSVHVEAVVAARRILETLDRAGILHDPLEPTLAEARAEIEGLYSPIRLASGSVRTPAGRDLVYRDDVLAILGPRKPEPSFKPGDWVSRTWASQAGVVVPSDDGRLMVAWTGKPCAIAPGESIRHATSAEIARARGEA